MANYETLKAAIQAVIKQNGNNEITGDLLQQSLLAMVNSLGAGYQYAGIATPATNPGTPDQNVFYLASTAGTYTNFGGLVLANGEVAILRYNGSWVKESTGCASLEIFDELVKYVAIGKSMVTDATIPFYGTDGTVYRNTNRQKIILPVTEGEKYYCSLTNTNNIFCIAALNNGVLVSSNSIADDFIGTYVVPAGITHICFCSQTNDEISIDEQPIVIKDSDLFEYINRGDAFLQKQINEYSSKIIFENAFAQDEIISGKYINSSGQIVDAIQEYKVVKLELTAGDYILYTPGSESSRTLWKYTDDSYSTGVEIIGMTQEHTESIELESGYYALAWSGSIQPILFNAKIFNDILSASSFLQTLRNTLYKTLIAQDADFIQGHYISYPNGIINANSEYYITDFFDVNETQKVVAKNFGGSSSVAKIAAYDENKNYLHDLSIAINDEIDIYYNIPSGVKYLRFCCSKTREGNPIVELINNIDSNSINGKIGASLAGNDASRKHAETLSNDTLQINDYPIGLKKGNDLSLFAYITAFGNGITIGYGGNAGEGKYIKITTTNLIFYKYENGVVEEETVAHNLSIETFIKVSMRHIDSSLFVTIVSFSGVFSYSFDGWGNEIKGKPFVQVDATTVITNLDFSITNSDFKCAVWAFGDSYFHYYPSTIMYWLREWGLDNMLVDGFGGENPQEGLFDLTMALKHGTPKYIVWCLGMNGDFSMWETNFNRLKWIINALGITLILCTIPVPGNTLYTGKQQMTDAVRASGFRYIDAYKAVGSNSSGEWYGNGTSFDYQGGDRIHPTIYGARAIASQWFIDFPEIMQYGKKIE